MSMDRMRLTIENVAAAFALLKEKFPDRQSAELLRMATQIATTDRIVEELEWIGQKLESISAHTA